jgi:hypothetical protein
MALLIRFCKQRARPVCALIAFFVAGCWAPLVWSEAVSEAEAKAVLLFHFTKFVGWPPYALPKNPSPFVIGILGEDPFGSLLDQTVHDETVDGRKIVVERYGNLAAVKGCQILFISRSEERHLDEILRALKDKPVLTVADMPEFARRGGTISLVTEHSKIRIAVNASTTQGRQLAFSSKLLRASELVSR